MKHAPVRLQKQKYFSKFDGKFFKVIKAFKKNYKLFKMLGLCNAMIRFWRRGGTTVGL